MASEAFEGLDVGVWFELGCILVLRPFHAIGHTGQDMPFQMLISSERVSTISTEYHVHKSPGVCDV